MVPQVFETGCKPVLFYLDMDQSLSFRGNFSDQYRDCFVKKKLGNKPLYLVLVEGGAGVGVGEGGT